MWIVDIWHRPISSWSLLDLLGVLVLIPAVATIAYLAALLSVGTAAGVIEYCRRHRRWVWYAVLAYIAAYIAVSAMHRA